MSTWLVYESTEAVSKSVRAEIEAAASRAFASRADSSERAWENLSGFHFDTPGAQHGHVAGRSQVFGDVMAFEPLPHGTESDFEFVGRLLCEWSKRWKITWRLSVDAAEAADARLITDGVMNEGTAALLYGLQALFHASTDKDADRSARDSARPPAGPAPKKQTQRALKSRWTDELTQQAMRYLKSAGEASAPFAPINGRADLRGVRFPLSAAFSSVEAPVESIDSRSPLLNTPASMRVWVTVSL